jgi:1-acyl-sn-glycerol-3-phosphate acyltransferase
MRALGQGLRRQYRLAFYWFLTRVVAWLLFTRLMRCRIGGRENVPPRGALIVVSNHMSWMDPPLLGLALPRQITFTAKTEIYRNPLVGFAVSSYGAIRVKRGKPQRQALDELRGLLARDGVVCLFPEGTRSRGRLGRGRPGVAMIAMRTGAPVLPVAITGTERVRGFLGLFTRPTITVSIGQPFTLPLLEGAVGRAQLLSMSDMIMGRIAALLPPRYRGHYALQPR